MMGFIKKLGEVAKKMSKPVVDTTAIRNRSKNIIGFYGAAENSGTTSLLMNIAEYLQGPGSPTVVVDLTMEAPVAYRYIKDEVPDDKSLSRKFRNATLSPHELVVGSTNGLGIISMTGYEHPSDYCELDLTIIESMLLELSAHYKYVLVDLGTSLNDDATIIGLLTCNKVYSVVRPIASQISKLLAVKEHIENIGHVNKIKDVIQTMILGNAYSAKDFEETGLSLIGNVAQDMDLMIAADNAKYVTSVGKSKDVGKYVKLVQAIGNDIKEIVKNTTVTTKSDIIAGDREDITVINQIEVSGEEEPLDE